MAMTIMASAMAHAAVVTLLMFVPDRQLSEPIETIDVELIAMAPTISDTPSPNPAPMPVSVPAPLTEPVPAPTPEPDLVAEAEPEIMQEPLSESVDEVAEYTPEEPVISEDAVVDAETDMAVALPELEEKPELVAEPKLEPEIAQASPQKRSRRTGRSPCHCFAQRAGSNSGNLDQQRS